MIVSTHQNNIYRAGNLFDFIRALDLLKGYSVDDAITTLNSGSSALLKYTVGQETRSAVFTAVPGSTWYLVTIVPDSLNRSFSWQINQSTYYFSMMLLLAFFLYVLLIYESGMRVRHKLAASLADTEKMAEEVARINRRYAVAVARVNGVVMECDLRNNVLYLNAGDNDNDFSDERLEGVPEVVFENKMVPDQYHQPLTAMYKRLKEGSCRESIDLELPAENGEYRWKQLSVTNIFDKDGKAERCIAILEDITTQRQREQTLRDSADIDALTRVYTRSAMQQRVVAGLEMGRRIGAVQALMVIDVDNFKRVNDTFGHQVGDKCLQTLVEVMRTKLRGQDIIGRLGGDEYMLFLPNVQSVDFARSIAVRITQSVAKIKLPEMKGDSISVSMGITICPTDADTYDGLYRCADDALYDAKRRGKNRYAFYTRQEP